MEIELKLSAEQPRLPAKTLAVLQLRTRDARGKGPPEGARASQRSSMDLLVQSGRAARRAPESPASPGNEQDLPSFPTARAGPSSTGTFTEARTQPVPGAPSECQILQFSPTKTSNSGHKVIFTLNLSRTNPIFVSTNVCAVVAFKMQECTQRHEMLLNYSVSLSL